MYRRNSMGANIITPKRILHSDFNLFFCQIDQVANFSSFLWAQLHDINLKNCMPRYQLDWIVDLPNRLQISFLFPAQYYYVLSLSIPLLFPISYETFTCFLDS